MAGPIRKLVQLVLDRDSARRTEEEARRSLGRVDRALNVLKTTALAVGGALVAALGVRALIRFGRESVRVAAEADAIWNRLAGAVENVGVKFQDVEQDVRAFSRAMQDTTTVGDEQFAEILTELITTSGDYAKSLGNVGVVADLAAAKQIDLRSAAQLVGRAMVGQTQTLTRYGIVVREGEDAVEAIRRQFQGMAENEAKTFAGRLVQLNNAWDDFKEAVGTALIAAGDGEDAMQRLTNAVQALTEWVERNQSAFNAAGDVLAFFGRRVLDLLHLLDRLVETLTGLGTLVAAGVVKGFANMEGALAGLARATAGWLDLFPGSDGLVGRMRAFADATNESAEAWRRIGETMAKAGMAELRGQLNPPPAAPRERRELPAFGGSVQGPATEAAERDKAKIDGVTKALKDHAAGLREIGTLSQLLGKDYDALGAEADLLRSTIQRLAAEGIDPADQRLEAMRDRLAKLDAELERVGHNAAVNDALRDQQSQFAAATLMAGALGSEYDLLGEEAANLTFTMQRLANEGIGAADPRMQDLAARLRDVQGEMRRLQEEAELTAQIAQVAGDLTAAAFGSGIGPLAAAKAKQNAILAAEQAALGFAASVGIITAGLAPKHFAAAAKFGAIAAAWGGLAGATGGFGGASAGGAASAGVGQGRAADSRPGSELHIYFVGEGFDAVNPEVQRVIQGALENAGQRQGNATVRIHKRGRSAA